MPCVQYSHSFQVYQEQCEIVAQKKSIQMSAELNSWKSVWVKKKKKLKHNLDEIGCVPVQRISVTIHRRGLKKLNLQLFPKHTSTM